MGGEYCFADGPDSARVDAVDALQGEDAAEESCAHDEDTAAEEDADDEFSVFVSAHVCRLESDVRTGAMLIELWLAGEPESRRGWRPFYAG